ncbi:MAG: hypothetical protein ABR517_02260 [Thermoanaerobaculia bacterium]
MKKFLTLTGLMLLVAATAMAGVGEDRLFVQPNATFATGSPTTTNNDDSCDIALQPAATLLLPYFEVEVGEARNTAADTNFTIVNTSPLPQIAHITLWTDWSFPVIDFNIFLTGYDVQGISLYDLIVRGQIPPTSNATKTGSLSAANSANPVHYNRGTCAALPGPIPSDLAAAIRSALTIGTYPGFGCTVAVGGNHPTIATGYATIDVARVCGTGLPTQESYFLQEIAFDNVLTGDYMYINPDAATGNFAGATPLVHIRAIPEGGIAGEFPTNLPYTFYDRYTSATNENVDRRQPLPGTFAARYIAAGETFDTDFQIWREGPTGPPSCTSTTATNAVRNNANIAFTNIVRFDESENPMTRQGGVIISPAPADLGTNEAFRVNIGDSLMPGDFTGTADLGGWVYMNLDNGGSAAYSAGRPAGTSQNWVTVSMSAEGRYSVLFDATMLGNGCSAAPEAGVIGPAINVTP